MAAETADLLQARAGVAAQPAAAAARRVAHPRGGGPPRGRARHHPRGRGGWGPYRASRPDGGRGRGSGSRGLPPHPAPAGGALPGRRRRRRARLRPPVPRGAGGAPAGVRRMAAPESAGPGAPGPSVRQRRHAQLLRRARRPAGAVRPRRGPARLARGSGRVRRGGGQGRRTSGAAAIDGGQRRAPAVAARPRFRLPPAGGDLQVPRRLGPGVVRARAARRFTGSPRRTGRCRTARAGASGSASRTPSWGPRGP